MTKPSLLPGWATDAAAGILNPGTVKQALGWVLEIPDYKIQNWWQNLTSNWIEYFQTSFIPRFEDPADLLADTSPGDFASIDVGIGLGSGFQHAWSKGTVDLGGDHPISLASDGEYLAVLTVNFLRCFEVLDGTQVWSKSITAVSLLGDFDVIVDGRNFIVHDGTGSVRAYDRLTGDLTGESVLPDVAVANLACDGELMVAGSITAGVSTITAFTGYDGTPNTEWSFVLAAGETVRHITINGRYVAVAFLNPSGRNYVLIDRNTGLLFGGDEIDPGATNVGLTYVQYTRDAMIFQTTGFDVFVQPLHRQQISVGPVTSLPTSDWAYQAVTVFGKATNNNQIFDLTSEYMIGISGASDQVTIWRTPDGGQNVMPVYVEQWSPNGILAAAVDPTLAFIGGDQNEDGDALVALILPPKLRTLRHVDVTAGQEIFRAPQYGVVTLESF